MEKGGNKSDKKKDKIVKIIPRKKDNNASKQR